MDKKLQKKINAFRARIGYGLALSEFIAVGVSKSIAQKLLAGTYKSNPRGLVLKALEEVMSGAPK